MTSNSIRWKAYSVARTGRIVAEFDAAEATQDKILCAAVH
jgi:hypothetical protein